MRVRALLCFVRGRSRGARRAERARAPFGHTRRPVFACTLAMNARAARFDVQVADGCFVAERRRPGQAVYGCGAR
jgi:hypothetical protein